MNPILMLHDTTEFSYRRDNIASDGMNPVRRARKEGYSTQSSAAF
jgi:hypothetical protein